MFKHFLDLDTLSYIDGFDLNNSCDEIMNLLEPLSQRKEKRNAIAEAFLSDNIGKIDH